MYPVTGYSPSLSAGAGAADRSGSREPPSRSGAAVRRRRRTRRRGPHGAAVAVLVRGSRDERVRGGPLGVAAGAELRVRVQRAADPPAVAVLLCVQGAAEGCRTGVADEGGDPGHEAGAVHCQHDGRICQICQAGKKDQQNDGQAQNSRESTDSSVGQDQVVYKRRLLHTAGSVDDLAHLEVLLRPCGRGAQQVDHPARPPGGLSYSSGRWNWNHLLDFSL